MRRSSTIRTCLLAPSALSAWLLCTSGFAADPPKLPTSKYDSGIQLVQQAPVPPTQPVQPVQPTQPTTPEAAAPTPSAATTATSVPTGLFGGFGASGASATVSASQATALSQPGSSAVSGAQAQTLATTDVGDLLGRSTSSQGVEVQRRSPIASDPRVRGYHTGQLTTVSDGAFWIPARADLDTIVSKLDSNLINNVVVIKGPYSVRYGPGFSFIDVETLDTPRYQNQGEVHGSTGITFKQNGGQWNGLQTYWGGTDTWGFRMAYNLLEGDDYAQGNGHRLPTEYNSKNYDFAYGFDLSKNSHVELKALRVEQQPVLFPGLIFDVNYLVTNGYTLRYVLENQVCFDKFVFNAWYNTTTFEGDNFRTAKREQIPQLDLANFFGATNANAVSLGFRSLVTWGREKETQITVGIDTIGVSSYLNEFDNAPKSPFPVPAGTAPPGFFFVGNFPIPRSHAIDPGIFMDVVVPYSEKLSIKGGGRIDVVSTNVEHSQPQIGGGDVNLGAVFGTTQLDRQYFLGSGYLTGEYKMNCHWTGTVGAGFAMRPPTLTEMYADEPFLGILQQGFTSPLGNPALSPEQAYQMDVGIKADYECFHSGANAYYSFIDDYITYAALSSINGIQQNSLAVQFTNTALATLAGFETYAEYDLYDWLTPFATMSYVDGRDHTRDHRGNVITNFNGNVIPGAGQQGSPQEPLPQIAPLETKIGIRLHQAVKDPRWGVEIVARIVDSQNAVATSLLEQRTPGFTVYNARAYWQVRKGWLLTGGIENFTNLNYQEHLDLRTGLGVFQPGFNAYVGTQLRY